MLSKLAAQESHGAPPGLYLLLFWVTFWPGAALAGMAAPAVWRARREPGAQYLLAWLIPSWIVFELVLTKLPHYVLPLYPAIAILTVGALERRVLSRSWLVRGAAWWFAVPALAAVIAIVGAIRLAHLLVLPAWPILAAAMIFGLIAWWMFEDSRAERSLLNGVIAAMFLSIGIYGIVMPSLTTADFLGQGTCRFALVEARSERSFVQRAEAIGLRYNVASRIDGYNISQGRAVSIAIFRSEGTE
jgi:4-amino-4-deoxy-L-arabinose transferase-like glycosyltransferase